MPLHFESYVNKGNEFLNRVTGFLEIHNRDRAEHATRSVLHALRDRLTMEESLHLIAQLPVALKGVYVDGWAVPSKHNHPHTLEDFLDLVLLEDSKSSWKSFSNTNDVLEALVAVFKAMSCYISNSEMEKVLVILPHYLNVLIKESLIDLNKSQI